MVLPEEFAATCEYYRRLFADEDEGMLGFAASVTVLPGGRDIRDVYERVGTVFRREDSVSEEELADAGLEAAGTHAVAWVARAGDTVVLVEGSGYAGVLPEVLGPLSWGGHRVATARFATMYPAAEVAVADDTRVEVHSLSHRLRLDEVPTLRPLLDLVDPDNDESHPVEAFAMLELLTGVRLDRSVLTGQWPAVWFEPRRPNPERPPGQLGKVDAGLALALQTAPLPAFVDASRRLAVAVPAAVGEADHPTARALLTDIDAGRPPDRRALATLEAAWGNDYELPDEGWPDPQDPVWQRSMAGRVLRALGRELDDLDADPRETYSWVDARHALGSRWDGFRDEILAALRSAAAAE